MPRDASVKAAFQPGLFLLKTSSITSLKEISPSLRNTPKYKQIAASLQHVGLIEPLVVFPASQDQYWLLDGNVRLDILKRKGTEVVKCLLATDDEAYTFNKRVNALPAIAEHYMILKAINNGVSEEAIACALNVDIVQIRKKRSLLDGICPEAVKSLNDKRTTPKTLSILKRMKPVRQVEAAELMIASNTYSSRFARALLAVTKPEFLVEPKARKTRALSATQSAVMEEESQDLVKNLKAAEQSYGTDMLNLTVSCRFVERLLKNSEIHRFLNKNHPELLSETEKLLAEIAAGQNRIRMPLSNEPLRNRGKSKEKEE